MIYGVNIVNFDVFDDDKAGILMDESIAGSSDLRLRGLNALIGRNNTGKTSFINALSFLKDTVTGSVSEASISRGRPGFYKMLIDTDKPAVFRVFFKIYNDEKKEKVYLQYELTISAGVFKSPEITSEKVLRSIDRDGQKVVETVMELNDGTGHVAGHNTRIQDHHLTALGVYGNIAEYEEISLIYHEISRWFFCKFSSDEQSTFRDQNYYADGNAPGGHKHLNSHGTNLDNVLTYLKAKDPDYYEKCVEEIKSRIPVMKKKKNLPATLTESPDRLFLYLLLLRDPDPKSAIFIEAPDKDLYHDMVDVLATEFREFTIRHRFSQIIFSTHNPYIVESMSPKEIWVFTRSYAREAGDVQISCAAEDTLVRELFSQGVGMGAIWYGGHLDEKTGFEDEN